MMRATSRSARLRSAVSLWRRAAPLVAFLLVGLAWLVSNPPGAAPDEPSHYVRMVGLANGQLLGESIPADRPYLTHTGDVLERVNKEAGLFTIPGDAPQPEACNAFDPARPFDCPQTSPVDGDIVVRSDHARYLPLPYVLPAVASLLGHSTNTTTFAGRAMFLIQDAALMVVAALALGSLLRGMLRPRHAALLVLSFTPLVAFETATLAPSGTELFASIAFFAALLAAFDRRSLGWLHVAAAMGVVAAWSRDLGIVWVIVFGVGACALRSDGARNLWARRRRSVMVPAIVLGAGWVGAVLWSRLLKQPVGPDIHDPPRMWTELGWVVDRARESVGLVGWLEVPMDRTLEAAWIAAFFIFATWAFLGATRVARLVVGAFVLAYLLGTVLLSTALTAAGFGLQARFTLPLLLAIPVVLVAGQGAGTRSVGAGERVAFRAACVLAAAGHLSMLLINAHRHANGLTGDAMDFAHVYWAPGGGWRLSLLLFGVAAASLLVLPTPGRGARVRGADRRARVPAE